VVSTIENDFYLPLMAFLSTAEILSLIFYTQHTHIYGQDQQEIAEILFGLVYHHFIHITAGSQLYLALHDALHRMIFYAGAIDGGISLQPCDQIVAVIFGFRSHGDVASMQEIKGTECYADAFAFVFEPAHMVKYHG